MRYIVAGLLGIVASLALTHSSALASSAKDASVKRAAGLLADRSMELHEREDKQQLRPEIKTSETSTPKQAQIDIKPQQQFATSFVNTYAKRELEWQLKLDALSEKLRLARETFQSATDTLFDFDIQATSP